MAKKIFTPILLKFHGEKLTPSQAATRLQSGLGMSKRDFDRLWKHARSGGVRDPMRNPPKPKLGKWISAKAVRFLKGGITQILK